MKRNNLMICSASDRSLHHTWLDGDLQRNWDLYLSPYRPMTSQQTHAVPIGKVRDKPKFAALHDLLTEDQWWRGYNNVMLVDEDIFAMPGTWSRFFDATDMQLNVSMSAPALTANSIFSHPVTVQQPGCRVRRVSFIEGMMPSFRVKTLEQLLPTFLESPGGWGIDYLWAHLLDYKGMYIIDATPVTHWRPSVHTKNYGGEMNALLAKFGVTKWPEVTLETLR
jgi:hypothetical protein